MYLIFKMIIQYTYIFIIYLFMIKFSYQFYNNRQIYLFLAQYFIYN